MLKTIFERDLAVITPWPRSLPLPPLPFHIGEDGDKKKKKKRRRELVLEEDDYELLEENTGIRRARPQQHRRLKKARDVGRSEDDHLNAEQLKEELFGPDGEDLEDDFGDDEDKPGKGDGDGAKGGATGKAKARAGPEGEDEEDFFDDDEDDWIVNEFEEEEGGEGRGAAAAAARRRRRRTAQDLLPGVDAAALDEANEIFGDVDDMLAMYEERKAQRGGDGAAPEDEDEYAGLEPDDLDDDDAAEELRMQREERKKEAAARRVREHLEPGAVERHFLLPKDELIREKDVPEREQLRRGGDPEHFDVEACAEWVWAQLIGPGSADTKAKFVVEDGMREVEGPPPEVRAAAMTDDNVCSRLSLHKRGWRIYFVHTVVTALYCGFTGTQWRMKGCLGYLLAFCILLSAVSYVPRPCSGCTRLYGQLTPCSGGSQTPGRIAGGTTAAPQTKTAMIGTIMKRLRRHCAPTSPRRFTCCTPRTRRCP